MKSKEVPAGHSQVVVTYVFKSFRKRGKKLSEKGEPNLIFCPLDVSETPSKMGVRLKGLSNHGTKRIQYDCVIFQDPSTTN